MKRLTSNDETRLEAARAWLHLGNPTEADKELEEIEAAHRGHPNVLVVRLEIYSRLEKWEGALQIVTTLISQRPNRISYWIQKSQILQKLGHTRESRKNFQLALESSAWSVDDLYDLAIEAQRLNCPEEAFACVRDGVGRAGFQQLKNLALETDLLRAIHPQIKKLS